MKSEEIISVLENIYTFEDKFSTEEGEFIPLHYVISDRQDFKDWKEAAKDALRSCKNAPVVQEALDLLEGFRYLNEKDDYGELCARIRVIIKRLKENSLGTESIQVYREVPTVFISYNQISGGSFVDAMVKALGERAVVKRDSECIQPWESIRTFMNTIREQNFAVLVITDEYLKSAACMYEVIELMKDRDWLQKVMFAVLDGTNIYSPDEKACYIEYWKEKYRKLENRANNLPLTATSDLSNDLSRYMEITNNIGDFLTRVADSNNPKQSEVIKKIIERIERGYYHEQIK